VLSVSDIEELYGRQERRLRRVVGSSVRAPEETIEDGCQFAWVALLAHRQRGHCDAAFGWLARTAVHEALRLVGFDRMVCPLEIETTSRLPSPHELVELRERIEVITELPTRQQRLLWLHAAGLSYAEMALCEGVTPRTVERQLLRGKRSLRLFAGHASAAAA